MARTKSADEDFPAIRLPPRICGTCLAWKPNKDLPVVIWGGCARGGTITSHYGDTVFKYNTPDRGTCSAWELKETS